MEAQPHTIDRRFIHALQSDLQFILHLDHHSGLYHHLVLLRQPLSLRRKRRMRRELRLQQRLRRLLTFPKQTRRF